MSLENNKNKERRSSAPVLIEQDSSKKKLTQRNSYQGSPDIKDSNSYTSTFAKIFGIHRSSFKEKKEKEMKQKFPKHIPEKVSKEEAISYRSNNMVDIDQDISKLLHVKELSLTKDIYSKGKGLTSVPESISNLKSLTKLTLTSNPFSSFPKAICQIPNLQELNLKNCRIGGNVDILNSIVSLKKLILDNNEIQNPDFHKLENLEYLSIIANRLQEFPSFCSKNLRVLNLSNNYISNFPDDRFTHGCKLKRLYLNENELESLPESLQELKELCVLDVSKNMLKTLPQNIGHLNSLIKLNISVNNLKSLPESIGEFVNNQNLVFIWFGNQIIAPPIEVVDQGIKAIANHFKKKESGNFVKNTRVKLMLLGDKDAGKTSLAGSLQGIRCDTSINSSTIGIDFHEWKPTSNVEVLIVDCAGEKKYALTHQLFISNGTIFVIVVNLRDYDEQNDDYFFNKIGYWMNAILSRSPNAVIMIVPTYLDSLTRGSDEELTSKCKHIMQSAKNHYTQRQEKVEKFRNAKAMKLKPILPTHIKFPPNGEVVEILKDEENQLCLIPISNQSLEGVEFLKEEILNIIDNYCPSVHREVDNCWLELENYLGELAQDCKERNVAPVVTVETLIESFDAIKSEDEMKEALKYLDLIGPILFFESVGKVFLEPSWLIKLLKQVFVDERAQLSEYHLNMRNITTVSEYQQDINRLFSSSQLSIKLLRCLWKDIVDNDEELFGELIQLLKDFELFYANETEGNLLVPWYFSKDEPTVKEIKSYQDRLGVRIETAGALPEGFFQSLIIRSSDLFKVIKPWQHGFVGVTHFHGRIRCCCTNEKYHSLIEIVASAGEDDIYEQWIPILNILKIFRNLIASWPGIPQERENFRNLNASWPGIEYKVFSVCPSCILKNEDPPVIFPLDLSNPLEIPMNFYCVEECKEIEYRYQLCPPFGFIFDCLDEDEKELIETKDLNENLSEIVLLGLSNISSLWQRINELRLCLNVDINPRDVNEIDGVFMVLQSWRNSIPGEEPARLDLIGKLIRMKPYPESEINFLYFGRTDI